MMKFLATWAGKAALAAIVLILLLGFLQVRSCISGNQRAAQDKVDAGQAGAFKGSVEDTLNVVGGVNANTVNSGQISRDNERNIRNAQGSNQSVDPDANARGLRALCRRAGHRNDPACRVP